MGSFAKAQAQGAGQGGGTYRRANGGATRKRGLADDVAGALVAITNAVPGLDEVNDYLYATGAVAADTLKGKPVSSAPGRGVGAPEVAAKYKEARARRRTSARDFAEAHPVGSNLATGTGNALTMVPAFFTGGATALPQAAPAVGGLLGSLKALAGQMGRGAATGGLSAALAGLLGDGELDERVEDANAAALPGAALGAAFPLAAKAAEGTVNTVSRMLTPKAERSAATAGRILAARAPEAFDDAARQRTAAANAGLKPPGAYAGAEVMPFERMGRGGVSLARAVAAVPGPGQDTAEAMLRGRQAEAADRMLASTVRSLGDDGSRFHVTLDALDEQRLKESQPLFEEAFAKPPVQSRTLEQLATRPSIRDAIKRAFKLALDEGEDPRALGLFHMENLDDWASETPPTGAALAKAERAAARGGRAKAPQGKSLMKFIADGGGMRDDRGEIAAMSADQWHKGKAFQAKLLGPGADPDEWALRAWEAGYFPQYAERPTVRELLDALGEEMRGRPRYARAADPAHLDRMRFLDEAEEMTYRGGFGDDLADEAAYTGRPEPRTEPVMGEVTSNKAWHYVKRGLDDLIEEKRDPVTRKLPRTDEMNVLDRLRYEFRKELSELNPTYGKALWKYAGPSRQMDALQLGRKIVSGRMDPEDIATGMGKMSKDELDALKLGIARGLSDQFRSENPQRAIRRFANDRVVQDRLRQAFGNRTAYARFMRDVFAEAEAQASYNRVLSGSRTTPLAQDIAAANDAAGGGGAAEAVVRRMGGQSFRSQAVMAGLRNWERMRQPGLNNPEVSRLLGEVLFDSGDPERLLQAMIDERAISPAEVEAVLPYLEAGAGRLSGQQGQR